MSALRWFWRWSGECHDYRRELCRGEDLHSDAETVENWRSVRPSGANREYVALVLQPGNAGEAPVGAKPGFSPATLQGQLVFSGKPPLNLARYIRDLKAYPYGCLEQTASGLFPSRFQRRSSKHGHRRRQR